MTFIKLAEGPKKLLIEALTSSEYGQTTCAEKDITIDTLHDDPIEARHPPCYCFTGLMHQIYHSKTGKGKWTQLENDESLELYTFTEDVVGDVVNWFTGTTPGKPIKTWELCLAFDGYNAGVIDLNDNKKLTFLEFSKLVEKQW